MSGVTTQTRDSYGRALAELAKKDRNVVALDCDLGRSTRAYDIAAVDPGRFFEMGIAEQDMVSTAAGLACAGKIPFANSFAVFITGRAFDQIRQQVSLPGLNVKICGSSAGITQGTDGATHQSVLDVALMRSLPYMTVINPADGPQTEKAVYAAYALKGPVYLRLSRFPVADFTGPCGFQVGRAELLREGREIAVCATGPVTWNVLKACDLLAADGLEPAVFNFHTVKPIDLKAVAAIAAGFRRVFTVEEHSVYGGLGSAVAEVLAEIDADSKQLRSFRRIGIPDHYGESGSADELLARCGLDPQGIAAFIRGERG